MFDVGNSGAAVTVDPKNGQLQKITPTANFTITLTAPPALSVYYVTLKISQNATARTVTFTNTIKWGAVGAPTFSGISKTDWVSLWTDDGGTTWYGSYVLGF